MSCCLRRNRAPLALGLLTLIVAAMLPAPAAAQDPQTGPVIFRNKTGASVRVLDFDERTGEETFNRLMLADAVEVFSGVLEGKMFSFQSGDEHEAIDPIRVTPAHFSTVTDVHAVNLRVDRLPASYRSVGNFDPNLHGYDIFFVDPFMIDNHEAKKGLLFERLDPKGRDYVVEDGNLYHKKGFTYDDINLGWGKKETKVFSSTNSFEQSFNGSIKVGVETGKKDAKAKGSKGATFKYASGEDRTSRRAWTYSRMDSRQYRVGVLKEEVALAEGFLAAIKNLGTPVSDASDLSSDELYAQQSDGLRAEYEAFIRSWGSHYPEQIEYGGYYMGIRSMEASQIEEMASLGVNLKASAEVPIKGAKLKGEGSLGYRQMDVDSEMNKHSTYRYAYRGGEGDFSSWSVGDGAHPVDITLQRLHLLLDSSIVPESVTSRSDLEKKAKVLDGAITEYIGSPVDPPEYSLKPRVFEIKWTDLHMVNIKDGGDRTPYIYGHIKCTNVGGAVARPGSSGDWFWHRSDASGGRVYLPEGEHYKDRYPTDFNDANMKKKRFVVMPTPESGWNLGELGVKLEADIWDYDKASGNDQIGVSTKTVRFEEFDVGGGKTIDLVCDSGEGERGQYGKAKVVFEAVEVNDFFSKLFDD